MDDLINEINELIWNIFFMCSINYVKLVIIKQKIKNILLNINILLLLLNNGHRW